MSAPEIIEPDVPPALSHAAPPAPIEDHLAVLFRLWLRERHVHPLLHLVRRYRAEEKQ